MAISNNAFWQFNEDRATTGYKSAWLVALPENNGKYSLVGLTTNVPYPFGDTESFEINVLQSEVIGQVKGKTTLESVDVPVYHHRDNVYRFSKMEGQVLNFMSINSEFVAYKYSGTLEYKPDTAEASENTATVTITVISASKTPVLDARTEIIENLCLANAIPTTVKVNTEIDFAVKQTNATPTFEIKQIAPITNAETDMVATTNYTVSGTKITFMTTGLMAVTIKDSNYASWTTTVYVE